MKTFIAAVLIFALLLLGVFWNMHYLTQKLTGLAASPPFPARNIFAGRRKNV